MGYGVDLLDCDAALYWWSDMMTLGIQPAIDKVFEDKHEASGGFPYVYFTGRMAVRMLLDNEPYVRRTQYLWALDLHDKAIRALTLILNDSRYVDHFGENHKEKLVTNIQLEINRLKRTRTFLAKKKAEGEAFMSKIMADAAKKPPPEPLSLEDRQYFAGLFADEKPTRKEGKVLPFEHPLKKTYIPPQGGR